MSAPFHKYCCHKNSDKHIQIVVVNVAPGGEGLGMGQP